MIRIPDHLPQIGKNGSHRSGWPFALQALSPILTPDGMLLDDFVDRTFLYRPNPKTVWDEPWIGMFHHPQGLPDWFLPHVAIERLWSVKSFTQSLKRLRAAIVMSDYLAGWMREKVSVPVTVVRHPTETKVRQFDPDAYADRPTLVQVGWYARNQDAINQVAVSAGIQKLRLEPESQSSKDARDRMRQLSPYRTRPKQTQAATFTHLPATEYDALLSRAAVFVEYITSSASNTLVECIARRTPIVINRHPPAEEYLGADYPLFYDRIEDVYALLTVDRVREAHAYLCALETPWITGDAFCRAVQDVVLSSGTAA